MSNEVQLDGNFSLNIPEIQGDFTVNEQPDINADLVIKVSPEKVSQLENDLNYQTKTQVDEAISEITIDIGEQLNAKADKTTVEEISNSVENIDNTLGTFGDIVTYNASDFATAEQGQLAENALHSGDNVSELVNDAGYVTAAALDGYVTDEELNLGLATKQDTISDLSEIRSNASNGQTAYNTIQTYGDIVTYDASSFATSIQGGLADTALQPNDNITLLNNNAGYITSASLPTVNNSTITIQKNGVKQGDFGLNQSNDETINLTVPTQASDINALPDTTTIEDLTTTAQQNAIDSGANTTNIGQIATNTSNINSLSNTVTSNYNTLDGRITSEVSTLNNTIGTETTNRQNADNNLQSQIDAIVSSSDVFDIVGTYAELEAYDITTVPVNDIIKVLVDSTHSNAATYYRCVEVSNVKSWSYIGSEGAYYTKSESDSLFVQQTTTVNNKPLSTNITLNASDVGALPSSTTIGNGTLTIQNNGANIDTFSANATTNKTINIVTPTKTSDLNNDSGFIDSSALSGLATQTDLTNGLATKQDTLTAGANIELIEEVEYVVNSDNTEVPTGVFITQDDFELDITFYCSSVDSMYLFMTRTSPTSNRFGIFGSSIGGTLMVSCPGTDIVSNIVRTVGHTYHMNAKMVGGNATLVVDDLTNETTDTKTGTYTFVAVPKNLYFYASGFQTIVSGFKIYNAYAKQNGEYILNCKPVDYNGTGGLYDFVSGRVLTATTGELTPSTTKTANVISNTYDIPPIGYGISTTAAATAEKVVIIPEITALKSGQIIVVSPTKSASVADLTIKLNGFPAYPILYTGSAITTSTDNLVWNANQPSAFVFNGTNWLFLCHGLDSNTTYSSMSVSEGVTGTATTSRVLVAANLKEIIQGTTLTGLDTITGTPVTESDSITGAIGKLQVQVDTKQAIIDANNKLDYAYLDNTPTIPAGLSDITVVAGSNISISGDTISATDTTYTTFTGADSVTGGTSGLVPAPLAGDEDRFLKVNGTWDTISGGGGGANTDLSNLTATGEAHFQEPLVSGTNIKTINNNSILGSGNLTVTASITSSDVTNALGYTPANTSLSNTTATGKNTSITWGLPNYTSGITLSALPQSGSQYTAPKHGVFTAIFTTSEGVNYFYINNSATLIGETMPSQYRSAQSFYIPLAKGDKIYFNKAPAAFRTAGFYPFKGAS